MDEFCGSVFWEDDSTWNTDDPDFTECLEQTVLVWIPCAFLWLFSISSIYHILNSKSRNIPWSIFSISKLALITGLIISVVLDLFLLQYYRNVGKEIYLVEIYTPMLKLVTWMLSAVLVVYNRKYGIRNSGVLFVFWSLSVCCGGAQVRTQIHDIYSDDLIRFLKYFRYLTCYGYQVILMLLSMFPDNPPERTAGKTDDCPIEKDNYFSNLFFMWLNPLVVKAYQRGLKTTDIWRLQSNLTSAVNFQRFQKYWLKNMIKTHKRHRSADVSWRSFNELHASIYGPLNIPISIWPALYKVCRVSFTRGFVLKLSYDILSFSNPIILHLLLLHIQSNGTLWHGILYAVGFLIVGLAQIVIHSQYFFCMNLVALRIRAALLSAICRKSLYLSGPSKLSNPINRVLNMMEVDVQVLCDALPFVHMLWSAPLCLLISIFYLWYLMGIAIFSGLAVVIIFVPSNLAFMKWEHMLQSVQRIHKLDRIKFFAEFLNGNKVFKLMGWDAYFLNRLLTIREREVRTFKKAAYLQASIVMVFTLTSIAISLLTFLTFLLIDSKNVLTPERVFVSLALFSNMHFSVGILPLVIIWAIEAYISSIRLNRFLNSEELLNVSHDPIYVVPVMIDNGTFAWVQSVPVLQNINLRFPRGRLIAIVGKPKSGKSSLLSAILGDMRVLSGLVNTIGKVAYVPQKDWIQSTTLQQNIIFGKPFQAELYKDVVESCRLQEDFDSFDHGDETVVSKLVLTASQKQKISLARALYSKANIYLLDNPLTALDVEIRAQIFEEIIGRSGILKSATRILVTTHMEELTHTYKVVVLKDGLVIENGSLEELIQAKGNLFKYLHAYVDKYTNNPGVEKLGTLLGKTRTPTASSSKEAGGTTILPLNIAAAPLEGSDKEDASTDDVLAEFTKCSTFTYYFYSIGFVSVISIIVCHLLYEVFNVSTGVLLAKWTVDKDRTASNRNTYLVVFGLLGLGQTIFVFLSAASLYVGCLNAARNIHNSMLRKVIRAPPNSILTDQVMVRFSKDLESLDNTMPIIAKGWLSTFTTVLSIFALISYAAPPFVVLILPTCLLFYLVQRLYIETFLQLTRLELNSKNPFYAHFGDALDGAPLIRAYNTSESSLKAFGDKVDFNQACRFLLFASERWLSIRLEIIANLILFFATLFAVLEANPHAGYIGLALYFALKAAQTLDGLVVTTTDMHSEMKSVQNLKQFRKLPAEIVSIATQTVPSNWPSQGTVVFKDVSVRIKGVKILKNINLVLTDGEKICVVGKPGSGKSALAFALFRLMPINEGEIVVDGYNITKISLQSLRTRLTMVPQETALISGSIKLNIDPYRKYQEREVWLALERAHLKDYVEASPFHLNMMIIEAGEELPLKIRQQICLTRGLIRATKILVIDDVTTALDLEHDVAIHKRIKADFAKTTIITITSRLNKALDSDRVLVMNEGEIAECDAPNNLLANSNSLFSRMCKEAKVT